MYADLLEGIFQRNDLADEPARAAHLRSLQPYARRLWQSYRQPEVIIDYAHPKTQEAYLLRYFPFYRWPLVAEMNRLHDNGWALPRNELLEAAFFGCGPCPEIIGLMQHLVNVGSPTTMISAQLVDSAAESWAYSRDLVLEHLTEPAWEPRLVDYVPTPACLTKKETLASASINGCHFAVVQNCLNEVPWQHIDCVVENIMSQFARLAPGAIALVIDRSNYPATSQMMRKMHAHAKDSEYIVPIGVEEPERSPIDCLGTLSNVPEIVTNNLFHRHGDIEPNDWDTNGLIFSKKINYISMAFQVGCAAA
tara:strand:- start:600 stop:1523 length:924 start_codon:yes stop_codon:yes gene_type:complete